MPLVFDVGSPDSIRAALSDKIAALQGDMLTAIDTAADEGSQFVQEGLRTAVTRTGLARQATRGGEPGRIETGEMIESVMGEPVIAGDGDYEARFGWSHPQDYFSQQEWGDPDERIPPAHALFQAFTQVRLDTEERLKEAVKRFAE